MRSKLLILGAVGNLLLYSSGFAEVKSDDSLKSSTNAEATNTKSSTDDAAASGSGLYSKDDIKVILSKLLKENPELVVEAIQSYSEKQQEAKLKEIQASLEKNKDKILDKDAICPLGGDEKASAKLVVFLDPNCPHCRNFEQTINRISDKYKNVSFLLRHWAILGPNSEEASRGLLAAQSLGKFKDVSNAVATSDGPVSMDKMKEFAVTLKIDKDKLIDKANSDEVKNILIQTDKLAKEIGLEGTPSSILITDKSIKLVRPTDEKSLSAILDGIGKES